MNHSCIRDCSLYPRMICEYEWTLELYSTMSRACFNCPQNYTDCLRENCVVTDGVAKPIEVVNKLFPGPAIQVCKGDTVVVNVRNLLRSYRGTGIHWHGMRLRGNPYMDGISMVSQCPILPFTTFQYRFVADDAGTHFWHSNTGVQRAVSGSFSLYYLKKNVQRKIFLRIVN